MTLTIRCDVADEVRTLGATAAFVRMRGVMNRESDAEFAALRDRVVAAVLGELSPATIEADPVLRGYRKLHEAIGRSNKKNVASTEALLKLLLETGRFPQINLLVDCYNLVSLTTRVSLGAHDLAAVVGGIHLRLTAGTEHFLPLHAADARPVTPGEYAYIDDAEDVLCRLEVRQADKSRITVATTECIMIAQGNAHVSHTALRAATEEMVALVQRFCGGRDELLYAPWR